jgi:hypothetical protein
MYEIYEIYYNIISLLIPQSHYSRYDLYLTLAAQHRVDRHLHGCMIQEP